MYIYLDTYSNMYLYLDTFFKKVSIGTIFIFLQDNIKDTKVISIYKPDIVCHLASMAGVRYSIEKPRVYLDSNIIGTYNIIEIAKRLNVKHLIMASSSSVYGANKKIPFKEVDKTETQMSIYAATKKSNESMAHSYSNIWKVPITMLRFFTGVVVKSNKQVIF